VSLRAPKDTIESLRLTLQRFEQSSEPEQDQEARAEIKRILLVKIANLEALEALKAGAAQASAENPRPSPPSPGPAALPLPPQIIAGSAPDSQPPQVTVPPDSEHS